MTYGNQQNAPRLKKRDPTEDKADLDPAGKVVSSPAKSLDEEESHSGEATSSSDSAENESAGSAETAQAAEDKSAADIGVESGESSGPWLGIAVSSLLYSCLLALPA